ncbi:hypothetical protein MUP00_03300 [Candidatus Bathyarchaeota archaeon]|nr:hypothetical protein [Candidatus Bathyarchaeota archaeon]
MYAPHLEYNKVALTEYLEQLRAIDRESRAEETRLRRELEELRKTTKEKRKRWVEVLASLPSVR